MNARRDRVAARDDASVAPAHVRLLSYSQHASHSFYPDASLSRL